MLSKKNHLMTWLLCGLLCFSSSFSVAYAEEEIIPEDGSEVLEVTEEEPDPQETVDEELQETDEEQENTENNEGLPEETPDISEEETLEGTEETEEYPAATTESTESVKEDEEIVEPDTEPTAEPETDQESTAEDTAEEKEDDSESVVFETAASDFYYEIINGEVSIQGYGGEDGVVVIPSEIEGYPVTEIDEAAFSNAYGFNDHIISVVIPNTVKKIKPGAFEYCNLISVTIPGSVTRIGDHAFRGCFSLTSVTILEGVTEIGNFAFQACRSLTSISIPDSVISIDVNAFYNCSSLNNITIPASVINIYEYAFLNCTNLSKVTFLANENEIEWIGPGVFGNCAFTTAGPIGSGSDFEFVWKTEIPNNIFEYCYSLTTVVLPEGLKSIFECAFKDCNSLQGINIPQSVTRIGYGAFKGCSSLNNIILPGNLKSLGSSAFSGCSSLSSITVPYGITNIYSSTFSGCSSLTDVLIPVSLKSIDSYAFSGCDSLMSVTIPEGVTSIGECAFKYCSSLQTIKLPKNLPSINKETFCECINLTNITIPYSVTSIGAYAFEHCHSLTDVYYGGTEEDWKEIKFSHDQYGGNARYDLNRATIHYTPGAGRERISYTTTEFDYDLAVTCAEYSALAYEDYQETINSDGTHAFYSSGNNDSALLKRLSKDCQDVQKFNFDNPIEDGSSFVIGKKSLTVNGEDRTQLIIVIRGTNKIEWKGNFNITGTSYDPMINEHYSFLRGAQLIEDTIKSKYNDNNEMVLITGHSRGGAVGNILARRLTEGSVASVDPSNVQAYLFAVPNVTKDPDESLTNIHNFCFTDDFVTNMPLTCWGFGRNGQTYTETAENLGYNNVSFSSAEFMSTLGSYKREYSFDKVRCIKVLEYVGNILNWNTVEKYYEGSYDLPELYNFMHNVFAPAAMGNMFYGVNLAGYKLHPYYAPIANFFVDISIMAARYSVNDTHQMFTYYNALTTGGFPAGTTNVDVTSKALKRIAEINHPLMMHDDKSEQYSMYSTGDSEEAIAERAVLKTFAENNSEILGWDPEDISTWEGVFFNEEGRVDEIDLQYRGLSGSLNFSVFSELEILKVGGNHLTEMILPEASETKLNWLTCENNDLTALDIAGQPLVLFDCTNNYLDIETIRDEAFAIEYCDFETQKIPENAVFSENDVQILSHVLTDPEIWDLNDDPKTWYGVTWEIIDGIYYVTALDISGGSYSGTLDVSGLTHLERLSCENNDITELKAENCTSLTFINCESNSISSINATGTSRDIKVRCEDNYLNEDSLTGINTAVIEGTKQRINETADHFASKEIEILSDAAVDLGFDASVPGEWSFVEWIKADGLYHVKKLDLSFNEEVNSLDLSEFQVLESIDFTNSVLQEITLPDHMKVIDEYSFNNCSDLKVIHLPEHLEEIGKASFRDCTSLENITLPESAVLIRSDAFNNCNQLQEVYFNGRSTIWKDATIESGNECLLNAKITFAINDFVNVESISFETNTIRIGLYEVIELHYRILPENSTNQKVFFTSSNDEVVRVDYQGYIGGRSYGTAIITATTEDGNKTAQCTVTVADEPIQEETGIYIKNLESSYIYTGSAIKPEIEVYDTGVLLAPKTDYTITFKNTTKAYTVADPENPTAADKKSAPQIIIKSNSKGNYKGSKTVYFTIEPLDINDEQITVDELSVQAGDKPVSTVPVVYFNGKKLKAKTDFTVDYNGWDQKEAGDHTIRINGVNNFSGTREITIHVASSELVSVAKLNVTSKTLKFEDLTGDNFEEEIASAVTVKNGKKAVPADGYHFEDIPEDYKKTGTLKFTLVGNEAAGLYGKKTVTVKITGIALSDKKVKALTGLSYPYTGDEVKFTPETHLVSYNGKDLTEGTDYVIDSYTKNLNAGTATVTLKGINSYTGTKKVNFKITPVDAAGKNIIVEDAYYTKGGSKPKVIVEGLIEGADYTVKYANNKAVTTPNTSKLPTVTITFKGNYKGTVRRDFFIDPKPLYMTSITAKDKIYSTKANAWKSAPVLKDTDGKTLKAGTDYEKEIKYTTLYDEELPSVVEAGTVIKAVVTGKGNYIGITETYYFIFEPGKDIGKASFKIANKEYTGSPVTLTAADITATINKTTPLNLGPDFEILSYTNNIKKGTAKVTFIGMGDYGGTKTVSFKIGQRSISDYWQGVKDFFSSLF